MEIHLEIIDRLDGPARFALAYTNHYFDQIVTRQVPPPTNADKLDYLCAAETWPMFVLSVKQLSELLLAILTVL